MSGLTKEQYKQRVVEKFGDRFDLSKLDYTKMHDKIVIGCKKHGFFEIGASNFITSSHGCPKCAAQSAGKQKTAKAANNKNAFIQKAKKVWGDKYSYEKVVYIRAKEKVEITCPIHGSFWVRPALFIAKHLPTGCPKCALIRYSMKKSKIPCGSTEEFIKQSKELYGEDHFDYSKALFKDQTTELILKCKKCGLEFTTQPRDHILKKEGCKGECREEDKRKIKEKEFIKKAKQKFGNKLDYSKVRYVNSCTKVEISCPTHGSFWQTPGCHLKNQKGCPYCSTKAGTLKILSKEEWLKRFRKIHGDKYDYSEAIFINSDTKIEIICKKHGSFWQAPVGHLKHNCPKCSQSRGEEKVERWLEQHGVQFENQKVFDECKSKRVLPFDFYLPEKNILIEVQGDQHVSLEKFKKFVWDISRYKNKGKIWKEKDLEKDWENLHKRDTLKKEFCKKEGIKLVEIFSEDLKHLDNVLKELL